MFCERGTATMDFISKMAASKMGQLKAEIAELKERLEETHTRAYPFWCGNTFWDHG